MLAAITAFVVMVGSITAAATPLTEQPDRDVRAGPRDLVVAIEQDGPDRATLAARFRLDSGAPGELRVESWMGDGAAVESAFSVDGVPHVWLRQVEGEDPEAWFSPEIEADPELMRHYWSVMTDLAIYESTAKNPACGALKWGLKVLTWFAEAGCCVRARAGLTCSSHPAETGHARPERRSAESIGQVIPARALSGGVAACVVCKAGGEVAHEAIGGIDCNKECKPDCPIG